MQQTELDKLLAAPYAEFERRVRAARIRALGLAGIDGFHAAVQDDVADARAELRSLRIEELVA